MLFVAYRKVKLSCSRFACLKYCHIYITATCLNVNNCTDEAHGKCLRTDKCRCTRGYIGNYFLSMIVLSRYRMTWSRHLHCLIMTKGPKWHSSLESLLTIPFTYKAWVWMTRQMSLHTCTCTHAEDDNSFVCPLPRLTFNRGHLYWTFNLLCNRPLCKWYSWNTQGSQCHLGPFVVVWQYNSE